jgi:GAF domain-containing protein
VEPIPETRNALRHLARHGEGALAGQLAEVTAVLDREVAGVVAFSVGVSQHDITLTYVSTHPEAALLDGLQYVDDGPCQLAARTGDIVSVDHEGLLDEGRWQLFAQSGAARGILSTLSLPVMDGDRVIGGVNLYGSRSDTFAGRVEDVASIVGGWATGAVSNADLSFRTRLEATRAPQRLEDLQTINDAVTVLVRSKGVTSAMAKNKLHEAAAQAGIPVVTLALMVIGERGGADEG